MWQKVVAEHSCGALLAAVVIYVQLKMTRELVTAFVC